MNYYKTQELAKLYKVSPRTINRWIEWSNNGKVKLDLIAIGKRKYVLNNPANNSLIEQLVSRNMKFKNNRKLYKVQPKQEFYETYNESQIIDIVSNIESNKEIPHKYTYFNGGAAYWDNFVKSGLDIAANNTIESLELVKEYLYLLIKLYKKVNIVDIGPGNGVPVRKLLEFLISKNILRKYIAIDYSPDILKITEKNIKKWFGTDFPYEGHIRDITTDSFQELLFTNTHIPNKEEIHCINLVLFLGSTIENTKIQKNYDQSLNTIRNSIGKNDLFVLGQIIDNPKSRFRLGFSTENISVENADLEQEQMILRMLNIDGTFYDVERFYSESEKSRIIQIRFKIDLEINIKTSNFEKTLLLSSGDSVVIYRHNQHSTPEVIIRLTDMGFNLINCTTTLDGDQLIATSRIKSPV